MKDKFADLYLSLFEGRPDTYAIRVEWEQDGEMEAAYFPSTYQGQREDGSKKWSTEQVEKVSSAIGTKDYGVEAVLAHLKGEHFLGVYPLRHDGYVKFFAFDFDGKNGDPWEAAVLQQKTLKAEAGLQTYIERSRSGKGYHLWGFLDEAMPAAKVRRAVLPFLVEDGTFDRMFPVQDLPTGKKPLGNLIALPLYGPRVADGKGVFVEVGNSGFPKGVDDQKEFLRKIKRIPSTLIEDLYTDAIQSGAASKATKNIIEREGEADEGTPGAFKLLSPKYGCEFFVWAWENPEEVDYASWYVLACQCTQLEGGRELFHQISSRDPSRYDYDYTDKIYDGAVEVNAPQRCETIRDAGHGPGCHCDTRFPGKVTHPYDLASLSIAELLEGVAKEDILEGGITGFKNAIIWAKQVEEDPTVGIGHPYGIPIIDAHTGLRKSELVIIGARPGMGKTAWGADILYNLSGLRQIPTLFFSMEMSKEQVWRRLVCRAAQVDHGRLLTGRLTPEDWKAIEAAYKQLKKNGFPITIDDYTRDSERMLDIAGEWCFENPDGVILNDYLQLGRKRKGETSYDAVSRFAEEHKGIAKLLDTRWIDLAQLNRSADEATGESQTYDHWLRGAGEIEQHADVIWFLLGEKTGEDVVERIAVQHKDRARGSGRRFTLDFHQPYMTFAEAGSFTSRAMNTIGSTAPMRKSLLGDEGEWGDFTE